MHSVALFTLVLSLVFVVLLDPSQRACSVALSPAATGAVNTRYTVHERGILNGSKLMPLEPRLLEGDILHAEYTTRRQFKPIDEAVGVDGNETFTLAISGAMMQQKLLSATGPQAV